MKWQSTPVLLPGKFYGQRNLAGYSPWDHKRSATIERLSMRTQIHVDTNTDLDKTDVHIYAHICIFQTAYELHVSASFLGCVTFV